MIMTSLPLQHIVCPATRPEQRPLVQKYVQLVAKLWVLAIFVGHIKSGIGTSTA
jgi:hypothetical protein